jgi:hypothetical protein
VEFSRVPKSARNSCSEGNFFGSMKLSRVHSSVVLFCRGVPVRRTLWSTLMFCSAASAFDLLLFRRCASSTTST